MGTKTGNKDTRKALMKHLRSGLWTGSQQDLIEDAARGETKSQRLKSPKET